MFTEYTTVCVHDKCDKSSSKYTASGFTINCSGDSCILGKGVKQCSIINAISIRLQFTYHLFQSYWYTCANEKKLNSKARNVHHTFACPWCVENASGGVFAAWVCLKASMNNEWLCLRTFYFMICSYRTQIFIYCKDLSQLTTCQKSKSSINLSTHIQILCFIKRF